MSEQHPEVATEAPAERPPWKALHLYWPDGDLWICQRFGIGVRQGKLPSNPWRKSEPEVPDAS